MSIDFILVLYFIGAVPSFGLLVLPFISSDNTLYGNWLNTLDGHELIVWLIIYPLWAPLILFGLISLLFVSIFKGLAGLSKKIPTLFTSIYKSVNPKK